MYPMYPMYPYPMDPNVSKFFILISKSDLPSYSDPRYADDTTLMAESEEELKSLLMKVKVRMKKLA